MTPNRYATGSVLAAVALVASCATTPTTPTTSTTPNTSRTTPAVQAFGAMREVLRDGHTEGRVELAAVLGPHAVAVGATAGLGAEITVVDGEAHLAEVLDSGSADGLRVRGLAPDERATLLVVAEVEAWSAHALPAVTDLDALEESIRSIASANGLDVSQPFPFRVEGVASTLRLHVLDHSCPIAHPDGPAPWRFAGEDVSTALVGFYAEGRGGVLTHHGQTTHTHAIVSAQNVAGHVDDVAFARGARLDLPVR